MAETWKSPRRVEEEIKEYRKKYLEKLNSMTTLEKFKEFINPDRDIRMDEGLIRSIIEDLEQNNRGIKENELL